MGGGGEGWGVVVTRLDTIDDVFGGEGRFQLAFFFARGVVVREMVLVLVVSFRSRSERPLGHHFNCHWLSSNCERLLSAILTNATGSNALDESAIQLQCVYLKRLGEFSGGYPVMLQLHPSRYLQG